MSDHPTANGGSQPRPRPFQFTLRTLLIATGVVALLAALMFQWSWGPAALVLIYLGLVLIAVVWILQRHISTVFVVLVACFGVVCLVVLLRGSAGNGPRKAAERVSCSNHLRQIAMALQSYESDYELLPPACTTDASGKPMHSWRVLILPYLDQRALYDRYRFDEPWDGPNNRKLHDIVLKVYACPSCSAKQPKTETNYVAVVGPQTIWPGKRISLADVNSGDGTTNTLLVVETHHSGIHWMEPRDLHVAQMPLVINPARGQGISSPHQSMRQGCALAVFADGHTETLPSDLSPETLQALLTRAGGEANSKP